MNYSALSMEMHNGYSIIPVCGIPAYNKRCALKLKVEGIGKVRVQPNMSVVVLGVVNENGQLLAAQEENTIKITAVIETLTQLGIPSEDIQTLLYNIHLQYDYVEGSQVFRGYRVEHMLEILIRDMDRIGQIIDTTVGSGANQINSIRFTVDDSSAYYQQALSAAVDDSAAKARTLGRKLNINILQVPVQIIELGYNQAEP